MTTRRPMLLLAILLFAATACGSGNDSSDQAASTTTAATSDSATSDSVKGENAFPVTIEHALGETTIEAEPTRVVTWGWASTDAAIALDVIPVAMPFQEYAGDEEGVLPWIREALEERGEPIPTVLPQTEEPPFEAIAAAKPDLILAVYSGITDTDYETLSQIAPTVAYPGEAWATPWRDTIEIVGEALGRSGQATELLADIDAEVAAQADAHPELAGKTVAMVWPAPGEFYVYKPADARVAFTLDLGLVSAPSVDELATGDETFYFTLSTERLSELTSDILVSFADTEEQANQFLDDPAAQLISQVKTGAVATVVGPEFVSAVSPPSALSLSWGLEDYVKLLSDAAKAADAANG